MMPCYTHNYRVVLLWWMMLLCVTANAQQPVPLKPRILISTDIGGTDPDDNQSMIHYLMYNDRFITEGLVSSPSFGEGSKQEILRMIDLYEQDLPKLKPHCPQLAEPNALRALCKQGRKGAAPFVGYEKPTEGSEWIVQCARKKSNQQLWVLVWGGLEDVAQALHDAPDIKKNIRVYWIGGPNKKWGANAYAYIAKNHPDLWMIENNFSYYGFFSDRGMHDSVSTTTYYDRHIQSAGAMGKAFKNYYKGNIKMGDTPSLLYLMDGNPDNPFKESWGGSFAKFGHSPRRIFNRNTTLADTVTVCGIMEFHFTGPQVNIPPDSSCFTLVVKAGIGEQRWPGYYLGNGTYVVRYIPKQSETISYTTASPVAGFATQSGAFVVNNFWPGAPAATDYTLGANWFTDRPSPELYDGKIQGAMTVKKWRNAVLNDWAKRWEWLK